MAGGRLIEKLDNFVVKLAKNVILFDFDNVLFGV